MLLKLAAEGGTGVDSAGLLLLRLVSPAALCVLATVGKHLGIAEFFSKGERRRRGGLAKVPDVCLASIPYAIRPTLHI